MIVAERCTFEACLLCRQAFVRDEIASSTSSMRSRKLKLVLVGFKPTSMRNWNGPLQ